MNKIHVRVADWQKDNAETGSIRAAARSLDISQEGAEVTLRALELGAVDFFTKPGNDLASTFAEGAQEICAKVKLAALAKPRQRTAVRKLDVPLRLSAAATAPPATPRWWAPG